MVDGNKTWRNYIGIASNILLGIGTCLLSTMLLTSASDNLGESPWSLPLLVFVLVIGKSPADMSVWWAALILTFI